MTNSNLMSNVATMFSNIKSNMSSNDLGIVMCVAVPSAIGCIVFAAKDAFIHLANNGRLTWDEHGIGVNRNVSETEEINSQDQED